MTKAEKIGKWIEAFNSAEFDGLGIMQMTIQAKDMLVHDMEDWRKFIVSDEVNVFKLNEQDLSQQETIRKLMAVIEEQNERIAIQSPDVVRCGNCVNFIVSAENPNVGMCNSGIGTGKLHLHSINWFCANGEIKT